MLQTFAAVHRREYPVYRPQREFRHNVKATRKRICHGFLLGLVTSREFRTVYRNTKLRRKANGRLERST
jgi:hypothetical protein